MPDGRLRELADRGALRKNLHSEIDRMVADEKSEDFVENFVGQWLQLRDMYAVESHERTYAEFERELAHT